MCFRDSPGISSTNCCPNQTPLQSLKQTCVLLKERSCHSQPIPRAQPPSVLWHVSTCLLFFPLHASPAQPQGPTSPGIRVCDPGAQTALHINLPGPPAVRLSAAAPLLHWMCYSHTSVRQPWSLRGPLEIQTGPTPSPGLHLSCPVSLPARPRLFHPETWAQSGSTATSQLWPVAIRVPSLNLSSLLSKTYSRAACIIQEADEDRELDRPRVSDGLEPDMSNILSYLPFFEWKAGFSNMASNGRLRGNEYSKEPLKSLLNARYTWKKNA